MNILLIAGGWSAEREVSLRGGEILRETLLTLGHAVRFLDPVTSLGEIPAQARACDFAFLNLHGSPGEDGLIQALLETLGCPYQGASPAASLLALNKAAAKTLFREAGLPTADWRLLTARPAPGFSLDLPYPVFIKDNIGGSTLKMEQVRDPRDLEAALDRLFAVGDAFIAEPAVRGPEMTCGVLGLLGSQDPPAQGGVFLPRLPAGPDEEVPMALPPILIIPASADGVFDYRSKYSPGGSQEICPAPVSAALSRKVQERALAAHRALGISGCSRADFIVRDEEEPVLLEVNTLPGMTGGSLLPKALAAAGISLADGVARLIELGLARSRRQAAGP
ncbi:MAG: D-alanine--D-alanine ligase [Desulfovibrio sp.]|jgi:D-alanine-D-alanine ligase|nr:D-alanine--D-alanine ligase [Desulfovibrio sp.]